MQPEVATTTQPNIAADGLRLRSCLASSAPAAELGVVLIARLDEIISRKSLNLVEDITDEIKSDWPETIVVIKSDGKRSPVIAAKFFTNKFRWPGAGFGVNKGDTIARILSNGQVIHYHVHQVGFLDRFSASYPINVRNDHLIEVEVNELYVVGI